MAISVALLFALDPILESQQVLLAATSCVHTCLSSDSSIPVGSNPTAIAFNSTNGNLYVTNYGGNNPSISVISGQNNTVIKTIPIPNGGSGGHRPWGIAFDTANGNLYVTSQDGVSVISGQTNNVTKVIPVPPLGTTPFGIAFDSANGNLYVTITDKNSTEQRLNSRLIVVT